MLKSVLKLAAAPLALLATPAAAQLPAALLAAAQMGDAEGAKAEAAIMEMFAKLFDTAEKTPIDPAQLALGQTTAARLLPEGAYGKMMDQLLGTMLGPILALDPGFDANKISELTGAEYNAAAALTDDQRKAVEAIVDPARQARADGVKALMRPLLVDVGKMLEPPMRKGIARAYARKFNAAQLTEMNGFFATPTGAAYAAESFAIQYDPEVMATTMQAMPVMMAKVMGSAADVEAKIKALPQERKIAELSAAELNQLAKLVGRTPAEIKAHGEDMAAMATAAEDAAAGNFDAAATADDSAQPWLDRANWTAEDRAAVAAIEERATAVINEELAAKDAAVARAQAGLKKKPTP